MEGRKRKKAEGGSVLDVFLILLLLFSLLTVALRAYRLRTAEDITERASVVLLAENVRGEIAQGIHVGERLYTVDGTFYGTVTQVRKTGSAVEIREGGRLYLGEWDPDIWCDLFLTVEVQGRERDGIFYQNGSHAVLTGQRAALYTRRTGLTYKALRASLLESENGK